MAIDRPQKICFQDHLHGPLHRAASQHSSSEQTSKLEAYNQVAYNLITGVASYHSCHILFITSESKNQAHTQGWAEGWIIEKHEC